MTARIVTVPCLADNYGYLVVCEESREAALVDAADEGPLLRAAKAEGVRVTQVWCTHHHFDHVGGNAGICEALGVDAVMGHASDRGRIPLQSRFLEDEARFSVGKLTVRALHLPGHTSGAIAYVVEEEGGAPVVLTGDTLFIGGCGRLFEGTAGEMHGSLARLGRLPGETRVYCGHEYTMGNLRFAAHLERGNRAIADAAARTADLRLRGVPTVPGTIASERATNPFLRLRSPELRATLGIPPEASDEEAFLAIRTAKDAFQ